MMAPRMAVATSLAHLTPRPTWPLESPTTTNACSTKSPSRVSQSPERCCLHDILSKLVLAGLHCTSTRSTATGARVTLPLCSTPVSSMHQGGPGGWPGVRTLKRVRCPARVCFCTGMIFMTSSLRALPRKNSTIWYSLIGMEKRKMSSSFLILPCSIRQ